MGSPDLCSTSRSIKDEPQFLFTMSEPNKTDMAHTERVDEAEDQEARPKIALSTILAVFVSLSKGVNFMISLTDNCS